MSIKGLLLFVKRCIRRIFFFWCPKPKVVLIDDSGNNNAISIGNNCSGNIKVFFRGSCNRVTIGNNCKFYGIKNHIFISGNGNEVTIGSHTTFDQYVSIVTCEGTKIVIDEDCMFAAKVTIRSSDQHPIYDCEGQRLNPAGDIYIGKHVWLGAHATVMKGVSIGHGTMVGYGSLVTKSLPTNCLAAGTPAKVLKENIRWNRTF